jgi:FixJ family two-component response regulator
VGGTALISIVDDDESIRTALRRLLKTVGFDVDIFASAEEFLDSGNLEASECLILDLMMPGLDGLELQSKLISNNCELPTIFLSAHKNDQVRDQALKAGAISFLDKPFSEDILIRDVNIAIEQHRQHANCEGKR